MGVKRGKTACCYVQREGQQAGPRSRANNSRPRQVRCLAQADKQQRKGEAGGTTQRVAHGGMPAKVG